MSHEVGKLETSLSLNADDFEMKISRANEEADKIDGKRVTVKVSADVAQALAEMDAVDAKAAETQAKLDAASALSMSPSDERLKNVASKNLPTGISSQPIDNSITEKAIQDGKELDDVEKKLALAYRDLDLAEKSGIATKQQLSTLTERLLAADREYTLNAGATAGAENDVTHALDSRYNASKNLTGAENARAAVIKDVALAEGALADTTGKASENANKAAESVSKLSEAQKKSSEAAKSSADALKVSFTGIQGLVASIPLLIGLVDALGSSLLATSAAFLTMAAAGALAFAGIREEIANGTNVGEQFDVGLKLLKDDMDQIARTSAVAMLDGFRQSVAEINAAMPLFTTLASEMSSALGHIGAELIGSLIGGLQKMQPLLIAGANEFGKFANFLLGWDQGNGFTEFMNTAMQSLPMVTQLLEGLITLVEHIFQAFQPLGPVILTIVNALVSLANAIPLPVLAGLVTFALEIRPAMSLAGVATKALSTVLGEAATSMTIFGMSTSLAIPVIGIVVAAIGALVIGLSSAALSQQQATVSATDYASALEQDNDAIGRNVTAMAAKTLADSGAITAAEKLGIGTQDLIGYIEGQTEATNHVNAAMAQANKTIYDTSQSYVDANSGAVLMSQHQSDLKTAVDKVNSVLNQNRDALNNEKTAQGQANQATQDGAAAQAKQTATIAALGQQYGLTAAEITSAVAAHKDYTNTVGLQQAAIQALADKYNADEGAVQRDIQAQMQATGAFSQTTLQMQLQNDAAGLLKAALDNLNNVNLSVMQAQTGMNSAILNVTSSIKQNGWSLKDNTQQGIANQQAFEAAAAAAQAHAEAVAKQTGSVDAGTAALGQDKAALENELRALGPIPPAVQAIIDKLYQVPPVVETQAKVDASQAFATIANLNIALNSINGRVATATITTINDNITHNQSISDTGTNVGNNAAPQPYAWGGRVARLAVGGLNPFAYGTDTEPAMLTPGEEVIPRSSAESMRRDHPGALEYIRSHGSLPSQGGPSGPITVVAYFTNPFTGEQVQAMAQAVAVDTISQAVSGAVAMRPGV